MKRSALLALSLVGASGCTLFVDLPEAGDGIAPGEPLHAEPEPSPSPPPDTAAPEAPDEAPPPPASLHDEGLVARYFFDEYLGGQTPTLVWDAAPYPQHLLIDEGDGLAFDDAGSGHGAVRWPELGMVGGAWNLGSGASKTLTRLSGATAITLELVVDVEDATAQGSDLFSITTSSHAHLGVLVWPNRCALLYADLMVGQWAVPLTELGRTVLHFVLDSERADSAERVRLVVDGVAVAADGANELPLAATLDLPDNALVAVGSLGASIRGATHYFASYEEAFDPARVEQHARALSASDDRPGL